MNNPLPLPSPQAGEQSEKLKQLLIEDIQSNGPMTFADYMQNCLYHPHYGYYSSMIHQIGPQGDFTTAPQLSPLFSQVIASSLQAIENGNVLEIGAGTGAFAVAALKYWAEKQQLPKHYYILEPSARLQALQEDNLKNKCPELLPLVTWLHTLPEQFNGSIIANEVLDAMPCHRIQFENGCGQELAVDYQNETFVWQKMPLCSALTKHIEVLPLDWDLNTHPLYQTEVNLMHQPWLASLSNRLQSGEIILIDYGYPTQEFYRADRATGTLRCHYQQLAHDDPFFYPGLQDITAHVDFGHLLICAEKLGLEITAFQTQAQYLIDNNLAAHFESAFQQASNERAQFHLSQQVQTLTDPSQMGELFKVLVLNKSRNLQPLNSRTTQLES